MCVCVCVCVMLCVIAMLMDRAFQGSGSALFAKSYYFLPSQRFSGFRKASYFPIKKHTLPAQESQEKAKLDLIS